MLRGKFYIGYLYEGASCPDSDIQRKVNWHELVYLH